jgi:glutathione S-transferase
MSIPILYFAPGSCALAALSGFEAADADYEARPIRTSVGEQRSAEYLAINPRGQLPAVNFHGVTICENLAVLTFIADAYPEAQLMPNAGLERAKVYEFLSWFATNPHVAVAQTWRSERFSDLEPVQAALAAEGPGRFARALETFEAYADRAGDRWLFGEHFGVADPLVLVAFRWAGRMQLDLTAFPAFCALSGRLQNHPPVVQAQAKEAAVV